MRLIDADELKNTIQWSDTVRLSITEISKIIDDASTVEASNIIDGLNNEIDDLSENLAWYINERNRLLKERRPQGEWIRTALYSETCYECNKCNRHQTHITKFCPNCGADMRGDKE